MITPDKIRNKAERRYAGVLRTILDPDPDFFPLRIPFRKPRREDDLAATIAAVRTLRRESKEVTGSGYAVSWVERRSARFGSNLFPEAISLETREDFLELIGRRSEFETISDQVNRLRDEFPELLPLLKKAAPNRVEWLTQQGLVDGLVALTRFVQTHPRCGLFPRELPVAVDTKFVERHESILRKWWDLILPASVIEPDEAHFARRFGLGYPEALIEFRRLDPGDEITGEDPFRHWALPLSAAMSWEPPASIQEVIIVENRVNFLTLPALGNTLAIAGMGSQVQVLRYLDWLGTRKVRYWGDIDAQGFEILARLRRFLPEAESVLMDAGTMEACLSLIGQGTPSRVAEPAELTPEERAVYRRCREKNDRLEQEKIPHSLVVERV